MKVDVKKMIERWIRMVRATPLEIVLNTFPEKLRNRFQKARDQKLNLTSFERKLRERWLCAAEICLSYTKK